MKQENSSMDTFVCVFSSSESMTRKWLAVFSFSMVCMFVMGAVVLANDWNNKVTLNEQERIDTEQVTIRGAVDLKIENKSNRKDLQYFVKENGRVIISDPLREGSAIRLRDYFNWRSNYEIGLRCPEYRGCKGVFSVDKR